MKLSAKDKMIVKFFKDVTDKLVAGMEDGWKLANIYTTLNNFPLYIDVCISRICAQIVNENHVSQDRYEDYEIWYVYFIPSNLQNDVVEIRGTNVVYGQRILINYEDPEKAAKEISKIIGMKEAQP